MAITDGFPALTADRRRPHPAAPPGPPRFRAMCVTGAVAAAVPEQRRFARRTAQHWAVPEDASATVALVVSELVTNAVLHSGGSDVTGLIVFDGVAVTVEIADSGRWLVRDADRSVTEDAGAESGRGLDLVRACTSRFTLHASAAGTKAVARISVREHGAHQ
ncbi:ATP-binding protein [Streptomyces griseochromogenes]|uniref:ATP-binding protein n=1 Tax=Streptomyces griseochromogenes TaxID=68214 RepID=UPI003787A6B6